MAEHTFQVDLRGLVDLLSQNLYSTPHVYIRELLQNGIDAITARQQEDPTAPAHIRIEPWSHKPGLTVTDTGSGLTATQAEKFLATIGRSSKRDELLGSGRKEFLGQFGIGFLACFLVADTVEVISQSMVTGEKPIRWIAKADGTFTSDILESSEDIPIGTQFHLHAREHDHDFVSSATVTTMTRKYGEFLEVDISVLQDNGEWLLITQPELPWKKNYDSPYQREKALKEYAQGLFGFEPLAIIDLDVPLTGTSGVAFVMPEAVSQGTGKHRVYVKNMLLNPQETTLLPEWSFFIRAVLNSEGLTPTASREELRTEWLLQITHEELGNQLKSWINSILSIRGPLSRRFSRKHELALLSIAISNEDMLDIIGQSLLFETTEGEKQLPDLNTHDGIIRYVGSTEQYKRIAPVASAQGLALVNAGYTYHLDFFTRLAQLPNWNIQEFETSELTAIFTPVSWEEAEGSREALEQAKEVLRGEDCTVILRHYAPDYVSSILVQNSATLREQDFQEEQEQATGTWAEILGSFDLDDILNEDAGNNKDTSLTREEADSRPSALILNMSNMTVKKLLQTPYGDSFNAAIMMLYLSTRLSSDQRLSHRELKSFNSALETLVEEAFKE